MAYTEVYMQAILPELASLPSIGSVDANFARTSMEEEEMAFIQFRCSSIEADSVLANYGIAAYEDYMAITCAKYHDEERRRARKLASKNARASTSAEARFKLRQVLDRFIRKVRHQ
ncbi:MAG: hypothetical protein M1830_001443 [Pleopsidium flavum]|nr:MAG: hypothetical protein M1830_001443 [Pleopsidium flavum]